MEKKYYDVVIVGGGTSGLFCAYLAGQKGLQVALLDHNSKLGQKLALAGGGMGNMTNLNLNSSHYVSHNINEKNRILQSLFKNFSYKDVLALLQKFDLTYEEREFGQIFCLKPIKALVDRLFMSCNNLHTFLDKKIKSIFYTNCEQNPKLKNYHITLDEVELIAPQLVIATGSTAYPQIGGSDFGLRLAKKWGHTVHEFSPALVPLNFEKSMGNSFPNLLGLEGISLAVRVKVLGESERYLDPCDIRPLLFTHQGLSGPAILVASCFWQKGYSLEIDFLPKINLLSLMHSPENGKKILKNLLLPLLPDRLAYRLIPEELQNRKVAELSKQQRQIVVKNFHNYIFIPANSMGFKKAEVAKGGIALENIKINFESKQHKNLFFCGELLDITGLLGGYNIHFALGSAKMLAMSLKKF